MRHSAKTMALSFLVWQGGVDAKKPGRYSLRKATDERATCNGRAGILESGGITCGTKLKNKEWLPEGE